MLFINIDFFLLLLKLYGGCKDIKSFIEIASFLFQLLAKSYSLLLECNIH